MIISTGLDRSARINDAKVNTNRVNRALSKTNSREEANNGIAHSSANIDSPYGNVSVVNKVQLNQYDTPHLISHLYNPTTMQADRKQIRKINGIKFNGNTHKMTKDSGYYSCEFLDKGNNSSPQSGCKEENSEVTDNDKYGRDISLNCHSSFRTHLPPSDSGVFTLSRSYSRPSRLAQSPHEGIYDNVL